MLETEALQGEMACFQVPALMTKGTEMGQPVPTKPFYNQIQPCCFTCGCTRPPPPLPVPPFLLMQNLCCQKWYNEAESLKMP